MGLSTLLVLVKYVPIPQHRFALSMYVDGNFVGIVKQVFERYSFCKRVVSVHPWFQPGVIQSKLGLRM